MLTFPLASIPDTGGIHSSVTSLLTATNPIVCGDGSRQGASDGCEYDGASRARKSIGLNGAQRTIELIGILAYYVVYVSNVPGLMRRTTAAIRAMVFSARLACLPSSEIAASPEWN